jgi:hypothetical protein
MSDPVTPLDYAARLAFERVFGRDWDRVPESTRVFWRKLIQDAMRLHEKMSDPGDMAGRVNTPARERSR